MVFTGSGLDAHPDTWIASVTKSVTGYSATAGCTNTATIDTPVRLQLTCPITTNGPFRLIQTWWCCPAGTADKTRYTNTTTGVQQFSQIVLNSASCTPGGTYTFSDPAAPYSSVTVTPGSDTSSPFYLTVTVLGCFGLRLPGATVVCDQTSESVVTDDLGVARIKLPTTGTFTGTISRTRFDSQTWSVNSTCTNLTMGRTLEASSGYYCYCGCPAPFAEILELIDPVYGSIPLVYIPSVRTWTAARLSGPVNGRDMFESGEGENYMLPCTVDQLVQCPIVYQLVCDAGQRPRLNVLFSECQQLFPTPNLPALTNAPADVDFHGWPLSPSGVSNFTSDRPCFPLDITINITFFGNAQQLYPGGPHAFRIREVAA